MAEHFKLPTEVLQPARAFIGLVGLNHVQNAVHRTIWDAFTVSRKQDRLLISFKSFVGNHEYPKYTPRDQADYEGYTPSGVLKKHWFSKHCSDVPSLLVLFYDLEWNDPQWGERQIELASRVQVIRTALGGRPTLIAVVLIQAERVVSQQLNDKVTGLCEACQLPQNCLFLLPYSDRIMVYILKLERVFMELSEQYYAKLVKSIKAKRDTLNKEVQPLLMLRHQFKISFFSEMKQDLPTALRYYNAAYTLVVELLDQRSNDDHLLEFKIIGGIISYKICKLNFKLDQARDALYQFQRHIDEFRYRVGPSSLAFEHEAWLTRQFSLFGDLFRDSVKRGLIAIQTQHPGIYYQQAAQHALKRKRLAKQLCKEAARCVGRSIPDIPNTRYLGQRPWRVGFHDKEHSSPEHEMECIQLLQAHEYNVEHSWQIIPLLTEAIGHFQKLGGVRMANHLKMLVGMEHYFNSEYDKALVLLQDVVMRYQVERWPIILAEVLTRILRCSCVLGRIDVYLTTILELIGCHQQSPHNKSLLNLTHFTFDFLGVLVTCEEFKAANLVSDDERHRLQKNMQKITEFNQLPEMESGLSNDSLENARMEWHKASSGQQTVVITSSFCCVESKASFSDNIFTANNPVNINVYIRSTAPLPMTFTKLRVLLNIPDYNQSQTENILILPGEIKTVSFQFLVLPQHIGADLEIVRIELCTGGGGYCSMELHWTTKDTLIVSATESPWQHLDIKSNASVFPCESHIAVSLEHAPPMIVDEWYPVRVAIRNTEPQAITAVMVTFGLDSSQDNELIETAAVATMPGNQGDEVEWEPLVELSINDVEPAQLVGVDLLVRCTQTATRNFILKLNYEITIGDKEQPIRCVCEKDQVITLNSVQPFAISRKITNMKCQELCPSQDICTVFDKECFLLHTGVETSSPWPICIKNVSFNFPNYVVDMSPDDLAIGEVELDANEEANRVSCLMITKSVTTSALSLGSCTIEWCRRDSPTHHISSTTLPLPVVEVNKAPFTVKVAMPAFGIAQETFVASYTIHNTTALVQEFEVKITSSEYFMLAGPQQTKFRVLPTQSHVLTYNMFPLSSGNLPLPPFQLEHTRAPKAYASLLQSLLPTHIYVKPSPVTLSATVP